MAILSMIAFLHSYLGHIAAISQLLLSRPGPTGVGSPYNWINGITA